MELRNKDKVLRLLENLICDIKYSNKKRTDLMNPILDILDALNIDCVEIWMNESEYL